MPLTPAAKVALASRILLRFMRIRLTVPRKPLPVVVADLARVRGRQAPRYPAARLSRAVDRSLRLGSRRPTCLVNALVLFRLLREQGDDPVLVIGVLPEGSDRRAHAWVEIEAADVGPPPGRGRHVPLARFRS